MNTVLVEKNAIEEVAKLVSDNQVVAFPTETVFGLGIKFGSYEALNSLYELKHRDRHKAISMMISNPKDIEKYAYVNDQARKIIKSFMPGMVTIILKKENLSMTILQHLWILLELEFLMINLFYLY